MNQEDLGAGAARRSQRPRSGLAIFDETLLFELHAEMMQKEEVVKRPRYNAAPRPPRPPSGEGHHYAFGGAGGEENSDDQRAAKRARSGAFSASRGSADEDFSYAEEDESNARTAWACGLNFDGLCEDERVAELLPPEANPQAYAKVRNLVLGMWRKDVSKKLRVDDVLAAVKPKDRAYALAAWQFLNEMGYINFGVSSEIQADVDSAPDTRGSVIVIGSGCAGLSAARQLRSWGYRVIVVEGRNRPGGRVFSSRLSEPAHGDSNGTGENSGANNSNISPAASAPGAAVVADLGGSIITGIDGNPLAVLTKQLKIPLAHIRDRAPIFMPNGSAADDTLDSAVEQYYNHVLMKGCNGLREKPETVENMSLQGALEKLWAERYGELEKLLPDIKVDSMIETNVKTSLANGHHSGGSGTTNGTAQGGTNNSKVPQYPLLHLSAHKARQLFEWHLANLEFANACKLDQCSLLHWDQDDPFELPGAHCFVPGCNGRWIQALCKGIPILYNNPVSEIRYCKTGVVVHTPTKVLHADAVVVTTPLGVLKRGGIAFNPPLSEHKRGAISRLGFGNLNKVILMFPKVFWSDDEDMFGHVAEDPASRGEAFLFYSYAHISGGAQLTALIAGSAAEEHEKRSAHDSVGRVMAILRAIFEPKGIVVPPPLQAIITRWGSDPMAYGAYSSLPVGSRGGKDYDIMAKSVGGRLFFAGEATTRRYPATMHGAFFTGLWAAADVDAALSKSKGVAQFSNTVSEDIVKTITRAEEEKAAAAAAGLEKPPPQNAAELALLDKIVQDKLVLSSRLKMLFDDPEHPPDLEVGSFKAVYGAPGSHVAHQALLRIDITSARGGFGPKGKDMGKNVNLYCVVLKDIAMAVAEQIDNYARVALLGSLPSVKLVDRAGLGPDAVAVMDSVLRLRRKQHATAVARAASASPVGAGAKVYFQNGLADGIDGGGVALRTYPSAPPQQQQRQLPVIPNRNSNGYAAAKTTINNITSVAAAAAAATGPTANGWQPYQQQRQQHQVENNHEKKKESAAVQEREPPAAEPGAAPGRPPPPAPPAAAAPAPRRPQSGFSALDIALGVAFCDILDLTGDD